jgi:predicted amidohydrolase
VINTYQVVACQAAMQSAQNKEQLKKNIDHASEMIKWAAYGLCLNDPVKLIAFSEFGIPGIPGPAIEDWKRMAIAIPCPVTDHFAKLAKELDTYIVPGSWPEYDENYKKGIFNTCFLVGPEGYLGKYRKVNPAPFMELSLSPHELLNQGYDTGKDQLFPVIKTEIGNIGMYICYDSFFPEVPRQLAFNGAEIFVGISAIPYPGGDRLLDFMNSCNKVRAFENMCYGLYVNGGAVVSQMPPLAQAGRSQIIDYQGRLLAMIEGPGEAMTAATFNIETLRHYRTELTDANLLSQVRTEAYDYWKTPVMKMHPEFANRDISAYEREQIRAKDQEKFYSSYYSKEIKTVTHSQKWWTGA